jgi:hypothetical protein
MRRALDAVLQDDDAAVATNAGALGGSGEREISAAALADVAEAMLASSDETMAAALVTQLSQVA